MLDFWGVPAAQCDSSQPWISKLTSRSFPKMKVAPTWRSEYVKLDLNGGNVWSDRREVPAQHDNDFELNVQWDVRIYTWRILDV